jgi:hypothetical protein
LFNLRDHIFTEITSTVRPRGHKSNVKLMIDVDMIHIVQGQGADFFLVQLCEIHVVFGIINICLLICKKWEADTSVCVLQQSANSISVL